MKSIAVLLLSIVVVSLASADPLTIEIRADQPDRLVANSLRGVCIEDVNHEIYGGLYSQMIFGESFQEPPERSKLPLEISGMWRSVTHGSAAAKYAMDKQAPFIGGQSQIIQFESGQGEVGVTNRGLNHWGMNFLNGRPYDGYAWIKTDHATEIAAELTDSDGNKVYARQTLSIAAGDWQRVDLSLTPTSDDPRGSFALLLRQPGTISIGYVFLEPGEWGRFKGLPVRKDVVEALLAQGVSVMRYGGSMVNSPDYRWKNMIGPRDRRPPYHGTWYPWSSNGWGIIDFLNLCQAMDIVGVPDVNVDESPKDLADLVEYLTGPADSPFGQKRVAGGHPLPYSLKYLELGNEERIDGAYATKFNAIADAIWAKNPKVVLIAGDFGYRQRIGNPDSFDGADSGIHNLDGQRQILDHARTNDHEVWFDIHIWSERLEPSEYLRAAPGYMDAIDKIANGAKHRVVCFELNANTHGQIRALANAISINTLLRDNRMPIITSANALQPDGENDNGWDQGLVFLNPSQVWTQPPGYVMGMMSRNKQPQLLGYSLTGNNSSGLDVTATRSDDGRTLVLQVVNPGPAIDAAISLTGFVPGTTAAHVTELVGPGNAVNTADRPEKVVPKQIDWNCQWRDGETSRQFPAESFTVIRFQ